MLKSVHVGATMVRHTCFFALIAVGLAICNPAQGQTMSFFRQSAPGTDVYSTAVTADRSGIYVFGNAGVGKYDSRGNELWNRAFSAPAHVRAAAVDASGVYGLGLSGIGDQSFLRKYSSEGSELWTRQLERSAAGLAADSIALGIGGSSRILVQLPCPRHGECGTDEGRSVVSTGHGDCKCLGRTEAANVCNSRGHVLRADLSASRGPLDKSRGLVDRHPKRSGIQGPRQESSVRIATHHLIGVRRSGGRAANGRGRNHRRGVDNSLDVRKEAETLSGVPARVVRHLHAHARNPACAVIGVQAIAPVELMVIPAGAPSSE